MFIDLLLITNVALRDEDRKQHLLRKPMSKLNIVVLTISDTRTKETDRSGAYLCSALEDAGHIIDHKIIPDDVNHW